VAGPFQREGCTRQDRHYMVGRAASQACCVSSLRTRRASCPASPRRAGSGRSVGRRLRTSWACSASSAWLPLWARTGWGRRA